jgi:hypothetical protein
LRTLKRRWAMAARQAPMRMGRAAMMGTMQVPMWAPRTTTATWSKRVKTPAVTRAKQRPIMAPEEVMRAVRRAEIGHAEEAVGPDVAADVGEEGGEGVLVGGDAGGDGFHAEEEEAEADEGAAELAPAVGGDEGVEEEADADGGPAVVGDVEGDELHGEGGADVGAEDGGDGLLEGHDAGVDEAGEHGDGGAGVGEEADGGAEDGALGAAAGGAGEDGAQGAAGGGAEAAGHDVHAVDEEAEAAEDLEQQQGDFK